jgi:hypothetical protein
MPLESLTHVLTYVFKFKIILFFGEVRLMNLIKNIVSEQGLAYLAFESRPIP